jgi:hypothetical protein
VNKFVEARLEKVGLFLLSLKAVELVKRAKQKTTRYAGGERGLDPNQNTFPIECECSSHKLERKGVLYGQ